MKKKGIIFGIIILVLASAFLYYFAFLSNTSSGTAHKMFLTEDGYEPQDITISKGDTIEFSTSLDSPFWPASNIHPTHGIYPEFDPQEPVPAGQTWSFTFDKAGEWRYHDHLAPYYTGTITVRE